MFIDMVKANRSYRRFCENEEISRENLLKLINLARLSPSGANRQSLRYYISCDKVQNEKVFPSLGWAAYFRDWPGPDPGERPSAYIIMVQDRGYKMVSAIDPGIAAQSILLGAVEMELGGCMIANIDKLNLQAALKIPEHLEILLVIAIGKPKEEVMIDEVAPDGDIRYWRDEKLVHHVPKRKMSDIVLN